ncbi:hypothetical protein T440DRAFT_501587 [Plenodomus tracheiphilus IPT5]|uniref:BTB domain-containing protein n=1 Tax=Plenodomus tracheiphilus IPT5 TaxID=1408161 RepID=A0A6A7AWI1_9PLEO|nr:hypothetical protein T440DRAFT_501587 [Plenodomus tracheiphilus IPT5]
MSGKRSPNTLQPATQAASAAKASPRPVTIMGLFASRACPQAVLRSYKVGDFTDLLISCGNLRFDVHQVLVCSTCDFFKKSVSFGKEREGRRIDLPEDDPDMICRLIDYCYLGNYDPCDDLALRTFDSLKQYTTTTSIAPACHSRYRRSGLFATPDIYASVMSPTPKGAPSDYSIVSKPDHSVEVANPLTIHASMYALADKYQVEGLVVLAREKFESCLHHHANSNDFLDAVQITYSSTPDTNRGLHDAVVQAFQLHFKVNLASIPGIEAKLDCIDELSFLLIKAWPVKTEPPKADGNITTTGTGTTSHNSNPTTAFMSSAPPSSMSAFGIPRQAVG